MRLVIFVGLCLYAGVAHASIVAAPSFAYDANCLDSSPKGETTSDRDDSDPSHDADSQSEQFRLLKAQVPSRSTSTSGSSSTIGGANTVAALGSVVVIQDDVLIARVSEEHSPGLPDPLAMERLRPPRAV